MSGHKLHVFMYGHKIMSRHKNDGGNPMPDPDSDHRYRFHPVPRCVRHAAACEPCFSDHALIARYVEVEVALARAEARCGVIPDDAADEIAARVNVDALDFDHLRHETDIVGYPDPAARAPARRSSAARPGATCTGAPPRRTSWTPPSCCRCATALAIVEDDLAALRAHPGRSGREAPRHADGRAARICSRRCP